MVSRRKLPDPLLDNVFNLLSIGSRYAFSFEWSDFGLKYFVTVMLKGQPPKFKASGLNFPISETRSKCNSIFRHANSNWVITMELKRKVEYSWACTFWPSLYRSLPWTWDGVRHKLSIATAVTSASIFLIFFF